MAVIGLFWTPRAPERGPLWGVRNFFFFQSCFFTLSDMFMTRINHKIDKNHPNNIFFPFLPNLYQILSKKGSKRAPPSASGHFWEFFRFFCANHLRNTFSSLYQQAGKIGKIDPLDPLPLTSLSLDCSLSLLCTNLEKMNNIH